MTQNAHLTNGWVFSLLLFHGDVCLLQEHQDTKNYACEQVLFASMYSHGGIIHLARWKWPL